MGILNVEIKAKCDDLSTVRTLLLARNPINKGIDHQIDTYFNVAQGRLKLREGSIENNLIHYIRENKEGPKTSAITLLKSEPGSSLKKILTDSIGILTIVDKQREIYYIENVKFHIDTVKNLGTFIEIEAIDKNGSIGEEKLLDQCNYYMKLFNISDNHLISVSYSDLILNFK